MSMVFRYVNEPGNQAIVSLNGRYVRPRPLIHVTLIGPLGSAIERCLLDSGADDTVFPVKIATRLGIDLTNAPQVVATGVGLTAVTAQYAQVTLRLAKSGERREWTAWVGFTSAPLRQPLLGFAGFLQFFNANFRGDMEEVELTANRLYPGT